jgi:hypothetical protein
MTTDLADLEPGDQIRHVQFPEYRARIVTVHDRIEVVLTSPPEQLGDRASLDRGDVANLWEPVSRET